MSRDAEVAALAEALRQAEADILTLHPAGTPLSHAPLFLADRLEANGWSLARAASEPGGAADLWTRLANDIRAVDGNHDLGAGELAHRLVERGWTLVPAASETWTHEACGQAFATEDALAEHEPWCTEGMEPR